MILGMIRKCTPVLIAQDICGVQPMPTRVTISFNILLDSVPRIASKYNFSRVKWYDANFDGSKYQEVFSWCTLEFGEKPLVPDAWSRWHGVSWTIYFRDEEDYVLFLLRWGA